MCCSSRSTTTATCICWPCVQPTAHLLAARFSLRKLLGKLTTCVSVPSWPGEASCTSRLVIKLRLRFRSSRQLSMLKLLSWEKRLPARFSRLRLVSAEKPSKISRRLLCKSRTSRDLGICSQKSQFTSVIDCMLAVTRPLLE